MTTVTFQCPDDLRKRIKWAAFHSETTMSEIFRQALTQWVERYEAKALNLDYETPRETAPSSPGHIRDWEPEAALQALQDEAAPHLGPPAEGS